MQQTHYKIKYKLQSVAHFGSHIGRDIEVVITSLPAIDFSKKKRVFPDSVTNFNEEIGVVVSGGKRFSLPIKVKIIEHDPVHNDVGETDYELTIDYAKETIATDKIAVYITEKRWYFWKKQAKFEVLLVTEIDSVVTEEPDPIPPKRIPTVDDPKWTGDFNDDTEQMILARMIFGEARESTVSDTARIAVGWSARNRVEFSNPKRFGDTYHKVILKPSQYSSFSMLESEKNNHEKVQNPHLNNNIIEIQAWENCYKIAGDILNNKVPDPINGANHFIDNRITPPDWAKPEYFVMKIDNFSFYDVP